ncbi:putative oxidoreductase [Actinacidiphila reveromycinica]|uniref:Putative oxidoreductase n=1 Tax=Actinacidiphila reveromycinica TaxID=659352 RepID=A0A7U3VSY6_9ACTN|nr:FAD-binding oxidoreductase [Streptomyces sp. SN-593]BBB02269.1 putative oxidoreductase [Streptomyces sp. SN-593]
MHTTQDTHTPEGRTAAFRIAPDDRRYADLTRGCNQRFVSSPDYVYLIRSTQDAVDAVQEAVDGGRPISVRSGGHCMDELVDTPEVRALLDTSELQGIRFDPERRAFMIEPGVRLGDMCGTLYKKWGVTLPVGSCPSVGVGGHFAGGAYGPLSRRLGYLVDYLCAVEVVVVDADGRARAVVATDEPDDPHRELWWAHTGGGGGNFGIVTRYWLRSQGAEGDDPATLLPKPPQSVLLSRVVWPWAGLDEANFARLVGNFAGWFERNSGPDSEYLDLYSGLILPHKSAGGVMMNVQMDADAPHAAELFERFHAAVREGVEVPAVVDEKLRMPWLRATRWTWLYSSGSTETQRAKLKAADLRRGYSDEQVATIHRYLTADDYPNPSAALTFVGFGGVANERPEDATAIPQRDSVLKLIYSATWQHATDDEKSFAWLRAWYRDVHRDTGGVPISDDVTNGTYINNPDSDLKAPEWNTSGVPWHTFYYKDNYPRLQRVKAAYDPRDVFHHALSVRPPSPDA